MFRLFSLPSHWKIPSSFKTILSDVENNKITELKLTKELFEEFGSTIQHESVHKTLENQLNKLKTALIKNTSIQSLSIEGYTVPREIFLVMEALSYNQNIKKVYLNCSVGYNYNSHFALAEALKVNNNIEYLFINFTCSNANDYMSKIIEALHTNTGLKVLAIDRPHVLNNKVIQALANLSSVNNTLERIEIYHKERLLHPTDNPYKILRNSSYLKKFLEQASPDSFFSQCPLELIKHLEKFIFYDNNEYDMCVYKR